MESGEAQLDLLAIKIIERIYFLKELALCSD